MKDMTKGNILPQIINFSLFIFIGGLMQNLYLVIDSIILGKYVGEEALAAVGAVNPINFVVIGFLIGTTQGFSVKLAKSFGQGNLDKFRKYFYNSVILCIVVGILSTIILTLTNSYILEAMNTPKNIFEMSHNFLLVLYIGIIFNLFYNLLAGLLRSVGNSFAPLVFLTIAVISNIILAFIFVAILSYGVMGSAFATIISQAIAAISCYIFIKKKYPQLSIKKEDKSVSKILINKLLRQGIPMGLQFSITGIGVIVVQSFLNQFSTNQIAGFSVAIRIQNIIVYIFVAIGTAMATFTSQNYGAKNFRRISEAVKITTILSLVLSVGVSVFVMTFGKIMTTWFTKEYNYELVQASTDYFNSVYWGYPLLAMLILCRNIIQGYGFPISAMFAGVVELVMRVFIVVVFTGSYGYLAICYADSITWSVTGIFLIFAYIYLSRIRKLKY